MDDIKHLQRRQLKASAESFNEQDKLLKSLEKRHDAEADRLKRYLRLPDLSRTPGSPLFELVERVKSVPTVKNFDLIDIPEIVPSQISFDLFDFGADHPARNHSDTYYVDEENILRTHDTVFWYYYLNLPKIKEKIAKKESLGALCFGKVYRKDEIDRKHMNIFHQMGGWYLVPDSHKELKLDDLRRVLTEIVQSIFGPDVVFRFNEDTFPYTDPSLEVEVSIPDPTKSGENHWVEILGGGMPKKSVLKKMGLEGYNGWAFGFGLERLAIISMSLPDIRLLWSEDERVKKQLVLGRQFVAIGKYPTVVRDISFIVPTSFVPNNYFDLVREVVGEDIIEEMKLLDKYEDEKSFGSSRVSYTYRIIYRHFDRTLTNEEVDKLHHQLEDRTVAEFGAEIR